MESFVCTPVDEPVISDEVRAELRRMEERLKIAIKSEILIELASQSGGVGTLGGESGTSARKDEEAKEQDELQDESCECALEGSVWDATLLAGTPVLGSAGTAFIALLIALNLMMQSIFIVVVSSAFTNEVYTDESLDQLRIWRLTTAHDIKYMDPITKKSMALRVCERDSGLSMSGSQVAQFALLDDYLSNGVGAIMCTLGIICWCLSVSREVNRCFEFGYAVACLPRGSHTVVSRSGGVVHVGSVSAARLMLVLAALACRFAFALLLLGYGVSFLINTIGIGDLLLNAVALEARARARAHTPAFLRPPPLPSSS